eukprot:1703819-Prymnesium_polylepis.1
MESAKDVDEATQNGLTNVIEKLCFRDVIAEHKPECQAEARCTLTLDSSVVQDRVPKTMEELAVYQQGEGIFTKSFVVNNAKTMAPAKWWSQYGKHLPRLTSVACRVLAQPCSASAAERNWSVYGKIRRPSVAAWAKPSATSSSSATRRCTSRASCRRQATSRAWR